MSGDTRRGPAPAGRPLPNSTEQSAAVSTHDTHPVNGSNVRLTGHPEDIAAEIVERRGPGFGHQLAKALDALVDDITGYRSPPMELAPAGRDAIDEARARTRTARQWADRPLIEWPRTPAPPRPDLVKADTP